MLRSHQVDQARDRTAAGERWQEHGLVFTSKVGTPLDLSHVRRDFRAASVGVVGVDAEDWTPRELRHSFVSLLSDNGVPPEEISRLVGHRSTAVTELVCRKQIRPVLQAGATRTVVDRIFDHEAQSLS
ncbi:MAG: tyrosine-type recombinase/integrase [Dermatophilaceae bacterium]